MSCCGHVFCKACVSLQQSSAASADSTHPCATCAVPLAAADVWPAAALRAAAAAAGEVSGGSGGGGGGGGGGGETAGANADANVAGGGGAGGSNKGLREILGGESSWGNRLSSKTRRVVQLLRAMRGMSEEWDEDGPLPDASGKAGAGGKGRGKGAAKGAGSSAAEKVNLETPTLTSPSPEWPFFGTHPSHLR